MSQVSEKVQELIHWIESLPVTESPEQKDYEVLPDDIKPVHYFLSLTPDLVKFTFDGRVIIDLVVKKATQNIIVNSAEITFKNISVQQGDKNQNIKGEQVTIDEKKGEATIPLQSSLNVGQAKLTIEFSGILNDKLKGFYRSKYKRGNGQEAYCGVTQFEATDARRAFPCWDFPSAKATFTVELTVPNDLVCLSNMPEKDVKVNGNLKTVLFEKSPIMSTYLLAWLIGDFEYVESKTDRNVLVRVWTTIGNKSKAEFACEVGVKGLEFYEKYFGIEYPLPKCDMVAVPDFSAGAMENWGLITYREVALLADKKTASLQALHYVAIVVCHELAHQWFGNLVTMDWWSQLWLNEGFACFMEYLSSDAIFPNWDLWHIFITREYLRAYELDGMTTSHPIEVNVRTAAEAEEIFDSISYCKGACIIRMIQSYLGPDVFRKALSKYLNNFRYSNAVTNDLWNFLSKESGKNVAEIMQNWTREQGFPIVEIQRKGDQLILKQARYLSSGKVSDSDNQVIWSIPITMRVEGSKDLEHILFNKKEQTFNISSKSKWIHLNANSYGFYTTKYDEDMMKALNEELSKGSNSLDTIDRVTLVRDTSGLAESGISGATIQLLDLIYSLKNETTYPVWDSMLMASGSIHRLIDDDEKTNENYKTIMRDVLLPIYNKIGFDTKDANESSSNQLLRPLILGALGRYGYEPVINESIKKFNKFIETKNENDCPPTLRATIFNIVVKYSTGDEFNKLKNYYLKTENPADKSSALRALGNSRDKKKLEELLVWILESDDVRSQDKVFPFTVISNNIAGRELAWQFLQKTWNEWFKKFDGGFLVQHLAKIPSSFVTLEKANEVEKYYSTINAPACDRSMKQCVETIRKNATWRQRDLAGISQWCQKKITTLKK